MNRIAAALLASTFLVPASSSSARAEPISTAIGLTAFIGSTFAVSAGTAAAIGGAIISTGIAIGTTLISSMIKTGSAADGTAESSSGTSLSVQYGASLARQAHMGPGATAGHHVYTNVYGSENKFLQTVFVIGDGQHGKLTRLRYNGKDCTLPAGGLGHGGEHIVPEFIGPGAPGTPGAGNFNVVIRYYAGHYDQVADPKLVTNANPAGRWTADHRGRGVAYLVVDQFYEEELGLTGLPSLQIETEGLVLYDPRKDSTNGGSGPHRWGEVDTYEPSSNPAIQEYNFRRGVTVNGQRILGMNVSPVNLLLQMYFDAANTNEQPIPLAAGGTELRYRCAVNVSDDRAHSNVLDAIRSATGGFTLERGGQFGPIPGVPQIAVSSHAFTDEDLIVGERASFTKYRSRTDTVTAVHGTFSDPDQFWASSAFPAREDAADDAALGEKLAKDIDLTQVYSSSQAQRVAEITRRRSLQQGQGTVTLPAKWIGVQPGDWLNYNSARHGNMTVLITNVALDFARHCVTLTYERTSNFVYSWTTAGELFPPDVGAGGVPGFIIMSAAGMSAIGVNVPGDNGLVNPGIWFTWTPILDPSVDQIDFEIRKQLDTNVLPFTADFPSSGSAVCSGRGIQAATNYEYRHKLYTTPQRNTPWSAFFPVLSGTQHVVPSAQTSVPIEEITLEMFEAGLKQYVGEYLGASMEEIDRIEQLIASEAAEQDAHNFLERQLTKGADTQIREQISGQFGTTWRGDWNVNTAYNPGDQVSYLGQMYWTDQAVVGIAPPAAPWQELLTAARISEEWLSFAGTDGAAAQTSASIETRFGADTLPISTSTLISRWQSFAGPDYAAAQTSDTIEARFGSASPSQSLATVSSQWVAFADPTGAISSTRTQLVAAIDGSSATIEGQQTAVAKVNGSLAATWQVTVNVNNYISGIKLYGTATTSDFVVLTDTFLIAKPGLPNDPVPKPLFEVGTDQYGTAAKIVLKGDLIASGTITANAIVAGSITSIQLYSGAVEANRIQANNISVNTIQATHLQADAAVFARVQPGGSEFDVTALGTVGDHFANVVSQSYTFLTNNPVLVCANVDAKTNNAFDSDTVSFEVVVDSTKIGTIAVCECTLGRSIYAIRGSGAIGRGGIIGPHTIQLRMNYNITGASLGTLRSVRIQQCSIAVFEPRNFQ